MSRSPREAFPAAEARMEDYSTALSVILDAATDVAQPGKALVLAFCDAAIPQWEIRVVALSTLPQNFRDFGRSLWAENKVPLMVSLCAGVDHTCEARMFGVRRPT